jgi:hypothetical protein
MVEKCKSVPQLGKEYYYHTRNMYSENPLLENVIFKKVNFIEMSTLTKGDGCFD